MIEIIVSKAHPAPVGLNLFFLNLMFSLTDIASNFTAPIYMTSSNFTRRAMLIRMIKEINPAFRSSKHDTTNDLLRKYRDTLPKRSFIDALKDRFQNGALIDFLKHPVDEASIRVPAKDVAEYLHHKSNESGFYQQMGLDKSEQAELTDGKTWRWKQSRRIFEAGGSRKKRPESARLGRGVVFGRHT